MQTTNQRSAVTCSWATQHLIELCL